MALPTVDVGSGPQAAGRLIYKQGLDVGADLFAGYTKRRFIHCNVSATYRIYTPDNQYNDRYLTKGMTYGFESVKITTTGDAPVGDGDLTVEA
jgi:hypothetical protein